MAHGMVDLAQFAEGSGGDSWIQIMKTGEWQHPKLKQVSITQNDLAQFADNFKRNVRGVDLAVDVSHNPDAGAVAWFKDVRVDNGKLMAKVDWTKEGAELVKSGKYRYFSPEFMFQWKDPATGQSHKNVLLGGALTNRPFLKGMEPVAFSETGMGEVWFADNEDTGGLGYDPDGDGDNDSSTDPSENPDWMQDVMSGVTPWPSHDPEQQKKLMDVGSTKEACDAAFSARQKQMGDKGYAAKMTEKLVAIMMAEDKVTNAHKSPPKGKPTDKSEYADPDNYKYPIDAKHINAALTYFNQGGQQSDGGYSDEQWASIGRKIASAANRLIGPGHSFKDGKIETPSNSTQMSEPTVTGDNSDDPDEDNPDDGVTTPHGDDDTNAGQFREPNGGGKVKDQVVTMAEFQAAQAEIVKLKEQNRRAQLTEKVRGWMFNEQTKTGKLVPAQQDKVVDMLMAMSDEQVAKFEEVLNAQPDLVTFGEVGFSGANFTGGAGDKSDQVVKLAEKYQRDEKMEWREAFERASAELGVE